MRPREIIGSVDRAAARLAEAGRRSRPFDRLMYLCSAAGDDGRVWFAAIAVEAWRSDHPVDMLTRALIWLGIESAVVNGPMKSATKRDRPDRAADLRDVRIPRNSSFPSGHAASSATMATILSDGSPLAPLWWTLAAGISWSRVHVGVHHASDVLGGLAIGTGLGALARTLR